MKLIKMLVRFRVPGMPGFKGKRRSAGLFSELFFYRERSHIVDLCRLGYGGCEKPATTEALCETAEQA
ncbi:MAG: hypothetical protein HFG56_13005 [Lachnospiraceae bacterium]|nr:hypothetical protein [Lachnospiraceae bacterium]MCI9284167.1 hypothetical protein [Lachnospiraceae bacterium]